MMKKQGSAQAEKGEKNASTGALRATAAKIALAGASILLVLVALELGLRTLEHPLVRTHHSRIAVEYDPVRGWRNIPNHSSTFSRSEYQVNLQYNSQGIRGPERTLSKPDGTTRILLLGDSFVEAYQVEEHERVSEQLAGILEDRNLGPIEVIAMGTGGYSTDQQLLWLRSEGLKYSPDIVVYMYFFNDTYPNISQTYLQRGGKPVFALEDGELRLSNVPVPRPADVQGSSNLVTPAFISARMRNAPHVARTLVELGLYDLPEGLVLLDKDVAVGPLLSELTVYLREPLPNTIRAREMTNALVRAMKHDVEESGASFLVMRIPLREELLPDPAFESFLLSLGITPSAFDKHADRRAIGELSKREGIALIEPFQSLIASPGRGVPFYYKDDIHWNADGHAFAAELLADRLAPLLASRLSYVAPRLTPRASAERVR